MPRLLCICSSALVLFAAYTSDLNYFIANAAKFPYFQGVQLDFSLSNPYVVVGLLIGVILILGGLTFFPALALGPIVEHFAMIARTLY